jgi:hypothetical protein
LPVAAAMEAEHDWVDAIDSPLLAGPQPHFDFIHKAAAAERDDS